MSELSQLLATAYVALYLGKSHTTERKVANSWQAFWAWLMPNLLKKKTEFLDLKLLFNFYVFNFFS